MTQDRQHAGSFRSRVCGYSLCFSQGFSRVPFFESGKVLSIVFITDFRVQPLVGGGHRGVWQTASPVGCIRGVGCAPPPPVHMPCYSHRPSRCSRAVRGSQGWVLRILRPSGTDGRERVGVGRVETAWREALGLGHGGAWAAPSARTFGNGSHWRESERGRGGASRAEARDTVE